MDPKHSHSVTERLSGLSLPLDFIFLKEDVVFCLLYGSELKDLQGDKLTLEKWLSSNLFCYRSGFSDVCNGPAKITDCYHQAEKACEFGLYTKKRTIDVREVDFHTQSSKDLYRYVNHTLKLHVEMLDEKQVEKTLNHVFEEIGHCRLTLLQINQMFQQFVWALPENIKMELMNKEAEIKQLFVPGLPLCKLQRELQPGLNLP